MSVSPVPVPAYVLVGLARVRESGLTNMLDRLAVASLASDFGHSRASAWILANRDAYSRGIFAGFVAEPEPPPGSAVEDGGGR